MHTKNALKIYTKNPQKIYTKNASETDLSLVLPLSSNLFLLSSSPLSSSLNLSIYLLSQRWEISVSERGEIKRGLKKRERERAGVERECLPGDEDEDNSNEGDDDESGGPSALRSGSPAVKKVDFFHSYFLSNLSEPNLPVKLAGCNPTRPTNNKRIEAIASRFARGARKAHSGMRLALPARLACDAGRIVAPRFASRLRRIASIASNNTALT